MGQRSVGCLYVVFFCGRQWRGADAMTKPVPDKAEIALEYPEKLYVGTSSARRDLRRTSMQRASR